MKVHVPPIKTQGIKTKLARDIVRLAREVEFERWVEPFCGSCVVALNVQPSKAMLCDSNVHIIRFYRDLQSGELNSNSVREYLRDEGERLRQSGEDHYYLIRDRFNTTPNSLDFLFLNRSCFNGVMRFNRKGQFNVPYCHKSERFAHDLQPTDLVYADPPYAGRHVDYFNSWAQEDEL